MQVVFPMAGSGRRFLNAGYTVPKPLIPVSGKPVIVRLLERFPRDWRFVFICNAEHEGAGLRETLERFAPGAEVVFIPPHRLGPVHTVNRAAGAVDDALPTIVNYCDFDFSWDPERFAAFARDTACDGAILCYRGFHPHHFGDNLYAYCREEGGRVREVREKRSFTEDRLSEHASSGSYYFATGELAKRACERAERENAPVGGEFYVSEAYNPLIADGGDVRVYEIPRFAQWGTPEDLEDCLYWERAFSRGLDAVSTAKGGLRPRLLMPMAGEGSRFSGDGGPPKPLRGVMGRPMFRSAMARLPCRAEDAVLVAREDLAPRLSEEAPSATVVRLDGPTEGQALTCLRAAGELDYDRPLLVSACDHGLLWDDDAWARTLAGDPDVVVFGQRGYPGARRSPASYSYIELEGGGGLHHGVGPSSDPSGRALGSEGRIKRIAVKEPLGPDPRKDLLLVGTFYFRRPQLMVEAIEALVAGGRRVGGEFYLDDAVNRCIAAGRDVRCFETDAYLCWGDPDSLREFCYWREYFRERDGLHRGAGPSSDPSGRVSGSEGGL